MPHTTVAPFPTDVVEDVLTNAAYQRSAWYVAQMCTWSAWLQGRASEAIDQVHAAGASYDTMLMLRHQL